MAKPLVSVVIVNYNGRDIAASCIASVLRSAYPRVEVILLDNASTDGSAAFLRKKFPKIRIARNRENLGYTGINSAMDMCHGKYIFFLNNDIELSANAITGLVNSLELNKKAALAVPMLVNFYDRKIDSAGTWVSRSFYNGHYRSASRITGETIIPYMGIGMIRRETVKKFGYLFDRDYFIYAEDLDLGIRIRLLGMCTVLVPRARAYHMHSMTMRNVPDSRKTYLLERNLLATFLKDMQAGNVLLFLPYVVGMRLLAILRDIAAIRPGIAFARIKAIFHVIFSFAGIMRKRKKVQSLRIVGDSFVLEAFSEKHLFSSDKLTI